MVRNPETANFQTFYIRKKFRPVWNEFKRLIKIDPSIKAQQAEVGAKGLASIGIMTVVYNYVMNRNPDFQLIQEEGPKNE